MISVAEGDVLLVEDDDNDVELMRTVHRKHQFPAKLIVARDGLEALEYVFGSRTAESDELDLKLIVLDLKLPRVDGFEVLRRVKADERTFGIPVIIFTSSRHESDVKRAYQFGANSYLVKPVDFDQYAQLVSAMEEYWLGLNRTAA